MSFGDLLNMFYEQPVAWSTMLVVLVGFVVTTKKCFFQKNSPRIILLSVLLSPIVSNFVVKLIIMLGHTGCGAVAAAVKGESNGYVSYITDDIKAAIGNEKDDYSASVLNVKHGMNVIRHAFSEHPEIDSTELEIVGAVYNLDTGVVDWIA